MKFIKLYIWWIFGFITLLTAILFKNCNELIYDISLGLFVSIIFYIINIELPDKRHKKFVIQQFELSQSACYYLYAFIYFIENPSDDYKTQNYEDFSKKMLNYFYTPYIEDYSLKNYFIDSIKNSIWYKGAVKGAYFTEYLDLSLIAKDNEKLFYALRNFSVESRLALVEENINAFYSFSNILLKFPKQINSKDKFSVKDLDLARKAAIKYNEEQTIFYAEY